MGFIESRTFDPLAWYQRVHKAAPKVASEKKRIRKLLTKVTTHIQAQFLLFVSASTDTAALRTVRQLLDAGNIEGALDTVDRHIARLAESLARAFTYVAAAETAHWNSALDAAVIFRPGDARAATLMQSNRLEFITDFTDRQRRVTNTALVQGMREGLGAAQLARLFRDTIGLTPAYQQLVDNYRNILIAGSRHALDFELRDARFDDTLEHAIDVDRPLTPTQIDRMATRYSQNMVRERAEVISRTTALQVMGQAQREMMLQTLEQTGINRKLVVKTWGATLDRRTRDTHGSLNGQEQPLDKPFISPSGAQLQFPGDNSLGAPPSERINCRCVVTYTIARDDKEVAELLKA